MRVLLVQSRDERSPVETPAMDRRFRIAKSLGLFGLCIAIQVFSGLAEPLFLSIDCGGNANKTNWLGINWVVDDGYIKTGKAAQVQNLEVYGKELNSLRYFPSKKKSCYVISGVATGKKHMVRATFFYGNYDKKSRPPSFDLQFDGNSWTNVSTSSSKAQYYEVIYAPKRDKISVCVARTSPDQIPFISSLEIRELETSMYETNDKEDVLLWRSRTAFGAADFVRYPDDPYDRYWHPSVEGDGVIAVARDNMSFIQNYTDIPGKALVKAITPASSNATTLTVPTSGIFWEDATYYYNFYFSEVLEAAYQNMSRSFDFLVDGIKRNGDPIVPPYQSYETDYNQGRYLTAGSVVSLLSTANASLPPILNAMEVFKVQRGLANGTNEQDVKALKVLQGAYHKLQSWAGDPCLPQGFTWDWLNCSADDPPRVTELHLNGLGLNGTLPDFSGLTALEIIDLSNNSLSGHIPEFLGTFPHLKELKQHHRRQSNSVTNKWLSKSATNKWQSNSATNKCQSSSATNKWQSKSATNKWQSNSATNKCQSKSATNQWQFKSAANQWQKKYEANHRWSTSWHGHFTSHASWLAVSSVDTVVIENKVTVETSSSESYYYEVIYAPKRDNICVCVAQTSPDQIPFITVLQIKEFEPGMYETEGTEDVLQQRTSSNRGRPPTAEEGSLWSKGLRFSGRPSSTPAQPELPHLLEIVEQEKNLDPNLQPLVSLSIDCGDPTGTRTNELGIKWVGDGGYINTGKTAKVQVSNSFYPEQKTLRYFPFQKKSCYVIPGVNRGRKHMVRAHFLYGNYDGKSSPPSFDLQFDGNHWATVTTSSNESYYYEVIYGPKRDNISVCVAQTSPDQIPFISALVIREFEKGMYETKDTDDVLRQRQRVAFGAKGFVRYPDDPYDRLWHPSGVVDGVVTVARDNMSFIKNFTDIPGLALANAITPASSNATTLLVPSSETDLVDATYYYNFYFSEVLEAAYQNQSRSFDFLVDGQKLNSDGSIIPPYQSDELTLYNHVGQSLTAGSNISLINTPDASLPPILNAMELFKLRKSGLTNGTDENDVKALKVLQDQYQKLQSWAGDPCLPHEFTWDWLSCSMDDLPRVTELHLNSSGLDGTLPDFGALTALEIIELSNNSLSGHIPEFLGTFPHLKELITGNNIHEDNPSPSPTDAQRNKKLVIVGVSVGLLILLLMLVGCVVYAFFRSQRPTPSPANDVIRNKVENSVEQQHGFIQLMPNHGFTYEEILKITHNFETHIGEGGSSSVYYGRLNNGNEVAVKVLKDLRQRGFKEFVVEVKLLVTVHHKNLVSFVGYCDEGMNMIVLYEYMHNGSLRDLLSGINKAIMVQIGPTGLKMWPGPGPEVRRFSALSSTTAFFSSVVFSTVFFSFVGFSLTISSIAGSGCWIGKREVGNGNAERGLSADFQGSMGGKKKPIVVPVLRPSLSPVKTLTFDGDGAPSTWMVMEHGDGALVMEHRKKATNEPLTWKRRLQIALDVAAGLEYLHSGCKPAIIHRDVKTTNILLNEQLEAKLADFGISRADGKTQTSTVIAGTPGYIDPEYSETSILTKKSDVYSFGVVLFELICGRPVRFGTPEQYFYIVQWATLNIMSGEIDSIIDPRIKGAHKMNSVWKVAEVAMACTARSSALRPHMYNILNDLKQAMEIEMEADSQELEVSAIEVVTTSESSTEASHLVSRSPRTSIRRATGICRDCIAKGVFQKEEVRVVEGGEAGVQLMSNQGFLCPLSGFKELAIDRHRMSLSIDCGAPTSTRTDELGIKWIGDGDYINTGNTSKVQVNNSYYQEDTTLRYFPFQKKSCYVIPGVARGRKHMVRAAFFYGNYDNKSSPPSFDLQFDGNHWASVTTSLDTSLYWEVIYAPKRHNISICVAQTSPDQVPFISVLEVKEFERGMYKTNGTEDVLRRWKRVAFGAKDFVRYPDDPYDRYWHPSGEIDGVVTVARDNISFIKNFTDIPGLALAHAITPASSNATTLTLPSSEMGLVDATYYYNFYFSEVLEAAYQNKSRSFDFLVDGEKLNDYCSIIPPYQSDEWNHYNHVGQSLTAGSNISLVNTPDASLPPILNAMELFELISSGLAKGTNENDVKALELLQGRYQQLQSWAGDPCLPQGFTWDWLNCDMEDSPRVTELHLNGLGLDGILPEFSDLTALEIIDMSNNSLSGQIPEFLGTFPHLKELEEGCFSFRSTVLIVEMATSLFFLAGLCIAIQIFSAFADKLFLSIDCGDPWGTRTDDLGIKWVGDGGYVNTGKTGKVQVNNSYYDEDQTLRYFSSQKRSCYVIPGIPRGRKHMIRASFFYGNYDGKSSPPSFDLQFDGNHWYSVTTSSNESYYWEVIYAPKRDNISVCVAQTSPNEIPFISSLVIRELAPEMYDTNDTEDVLLRWWRTAFGAKDFIRYPDDPYDRYWHPYPVDGTDGVRSVSHDNVSFISNSTSIPGLALGHAVTPTSITATRLTLTVPSSDSGVTNTAQFYSIFYFSEVSQAAYQNKSRSFDLLFDDVKLNDSPIFPLYLSCAPIRNRGQDALEVLRGRYQQLQLWTGDPCLPPGFNWEWLDCNADKPPRVTELHLNGSGLNGTLVDFSGLNALQIIDLSNNSLSGKIPDFWGAFPNLKEFIEGNNITEDNTNTSSNDGLNVKPIIIAVSVSSVILFLLLVGWVVYACLRSRRCRVPPKVIIENNLENPVRQQAGRIQQGANHAFTYEEIVKITCNFATLIGKGGSGSVYYGCIGNGNEVAVKVKFLMTVHHKNLVSFVGFCEEDVNMIILYEYMKNGSLRDLLSGKKTTAEPLTWKRRLQIALDIATGLEYIHSGCRPAIIHRDIKSTNILLNERLEAKLADFGISKADEKTQISTVIAGTPGYIDPEYSETGILTKKSDVYSFGVVLFELMSGHAATFSTSEESFHIVQWATSKIAKGDIESTIDPRIEGQYKMNSMWKIAETALACTARSSKERPYMHDILNDLNQAMKMEMETGDQTYDILTTEVTTISMFSGSVEEEEEEEEEEDDTHMKDTKILFNVAQS
ncbi:putative LRR receptor-like serine/threonine-protein kinase [Nymphaea thermarum]|nr:putative LRR receptor-like serine/threonine-protein kinase [Nymphaea thermarum]